MHFSTLALAFTPILSLVLSSPVAQPQAAAPAALNPRAEGDSYDLYLQDDEDHQISGSLEHVFDIISQIPESVLEEGDDAKNAWLAAHGHRESKRDLVAVDARDLETRGVWDVTKCAGAIAAFIASNAIGAAKLLRIKKYIDALGGVCSSHPSMPIRFTNSVTRFESQPNCCSRPAHRLSG